MGIAIVTGASSGLGAEFVRQIDQSRDVDEIWGLARNVKQLEEVGAGCKCKFVSIECDLTNQADLQKVTQKLKNDNPDVRMLVNCAGFAKFGSYDQIAVGAELSMISLDVRAVVDLSLITIPYMKQGAMLVNIASAAAFQPLPGMNVYAASKAFVLYYSRGLNVELADKGVSVTAVCPGWTKTNFMKVAQTGADKDAVKSFWFMSTPQAVVKSALKAAHAHKAMCVPGAFTKVQWFFAKILPASTVMGIWNAIRK